MRSIRLLLLAGIISAGGLAVSEARAVSPRNPYRSFNLSGINYGSMQWERAQRQGKGSGPTTTLPPAPTPAAAARWSVAPRPVAV